MATLTQHSQKAITDILKDMTRPISEILGEPPLTSLESRPRKRALPIPLRSHDSTSEADILAITRSYKGPEPFLLGGRVSGELGPPRKRSRVELTSIESVGKKRHREEKPPRHENGTRKRDGDTTKKPRTEEVKPRPSVIKLTSQPAPREAYTETGNKSRHSNGPSLRKKEHVVKEPKKETKKPTKEQFDDDAEKYSKQTSRKRPLPVLRTPASVVPRSEPRPLKSSSPDENGSDADRHSRKKVMTKKTENEPKRLLIPRVPVSEKVERHRRGETTKTPSVESPQRSVSSSERRRPRPRQLNDNTGHHRDHESGSERDPLRRDKTRIRECDRAGESDRERSDRERSDRERDSLRRSAGRTDREKDNDKSRDRVRNSRDRESQHDRDSERERHRESEKRDNDIDRVHGVRSRDRARDCNRDRERPNLRRSLPPSKPDTAREPPSTAQSPRDDRGASLSSRPASRSGSSQSPVGEGTPRRAARHRHGRAELQKNRAKQEYLEKEFKSTVSKCEQLYKDKDYDGFEEAAQQGFRLSFDLGLAKETELRLDAIKTMNSTERSTRKRAVIDHYKALTKSYANKRMGELEAIGRKDGCAFYKRGVQKVYFRMFCCHNLLDKGVQNSNRNLQRHLADIINERSEEELSTRRLKNIKRLVDEHVNILSIFESITADHGSGFEEAGAEGYVP